MAGCAPSLAQCRARTRAATAIHKALTNPVSETWSIALLQNDFRLTPGSGEAERWSSTLVFQGAFPVALTPH